MLPSSNRGVECPSCQSNRVGKRKEKREKRMDPSRIRIRESKIRDNPHFPPPCEGAEVPSPDPIPSPQPFPSAVSVVDCSCTRTEKVLLAPSPRACVIPASKSCGRSQNPDRMTRAGHDKTKGMRQPNTSAVRGQSLDGGPSPRRLHSPSALPANWKTVSRSRGSAIRARRERLARKGPTPFKPRERARNAPTPFKPRGTALRRPGPDNCRCFSFKRQRSYQKNSFTSLFVRCVCVHTPLSCALTGLLCALSHFFLEFSESLEH